MAPVLTRQFRSISCVVLSSTDQTNEQGRRSEPARLKHLADPARPSLEVANVSQVRIPINQTKTSTSTTRLVGRSGSRLMPMRWPSSISPSSTCFIRHIRPLPWLAHRQDKVDLKAGRNLVLTRRALGRPRGPRRKDLHLATVRLCQPCQARALLAQLKAQHMGLPKTTKLITNRPTPEERGRRTR